MKSTSLKALLVGIVSLTTVCIPVMAQHGGGHGPGGGGGSSHGGGGGGFHGGSYGGGGFHGGGYSGGYSGYHGTASGSHGSYGGMRGESPSARVSSAGRPWSWEGHSTRNTSPGWHGFSRSGNENPAGRPTGNAAGRPGSTVGRSPTGAPASSHAAVADGNWHSFGGARAAPAATSNSHLTSSASLNHAGFVSSNAVWHGGTVWHGGWYGGWHGCCWGGWGWSWGWGGWGVYSPFWTWPAYWYNPWLYPYSPAPYVLYPYPDSY